VSDKRPLWGNIVLYAGAVLLVVISVYPFLYTVATSFKTGNALFSTSLWPSEPTWKNYVQLFYGRQPFGRHLLNSIMVATITVTLAMLMAITASYALGRINFKGKSALLLAILAVSMFPQVAVLSGMFELMQALGLYNKSIGLVVPPSWMAAGRCASSSRSSCRCLRRRWSRPACSPSSAPGTSSCSR
jgi:trehalose/maltose transport system permease protein